MLKASTNFNIEGSGKYYLVLLNRNLLFPVAVQYVVSAHPSVVETMSIQLIILIVLLFACCCISHRGCGRLCGRVEVRASRAREAAKDRMFEMQ